MSALACGMKEELKDLLNAATVISLCVDIWSSKITYGYLGVTAHFIDSRGLLRSVMLGCPRFKGSHDHLSICGLVLELLEQYQIKDQIFFIATGNAANMIKAFKDLSTAFEETDFGRTSEAQFNSRRCLIICYFRWIRI